MVETRYGGDPSAKETIQLTGDIRFGDYDRFRAFLLRDFDIYLNSMRYILIASNGGDVVEAIKTGRLLREMYAKVVVPPDSTCVSACFVLYISAVERGAGGKVGIHRPYFDQRYFAGLDPVTAEKRHRELTKVFSSYLEQSLVPRRLIDSMNATSSREILWLTRKDIDELGEYSSWYEEFLLAKCKRGPLSLDEELALIAYEVKEYAEYNKCKEKVIRPELTGRLKTILVAPAPKKSSQTTQSQKE